MPQDDKKIAQRKLDQLRKSKPTPEAEKAFSDARKRTITDYNATKAKSGPALDTNNSAGAIQRARGLSSPALDHLRTQEQERMRMRDTPLSATPDLNK